MWPYTTRFYKVNLRRIYYEISNFDDVYYVGTMHIRGRKEQLQQHLHFCTGLSNLCCDDAVTATDAVSRHAE